MFKLIFHLDHYLLHVRIVGLRAESVYLAPHLLGNESELLSLPGVSRKAEGVKESDLKLLKGRDITLGALQTLALKYANAVILHAPETQPEVAEVLSSSKIKVLPWEKAKEGGPAFFEFINSIEGK